MNDIVISGVSSPLHRYKFYALLLPKMVTVNFILLTKLCSYA